MEFDDFHRVELPRTLPERAPLAARSCTGLRPFTFMLDDGRAYHFDNVDGTISIDEGADPSGTVLQLAANEWENFVAERWTRYGLLYNGQPRFVGGDFGDLCRWEPALRALFHGRPVYEPESLDLRDLHGLPLDLRKTFTLDDDHEEMRHFLDLCGYIHIRAVLDPREIEELRDEVEAQAARAVPNDGSSGFWTKTPDGRTVMANLKYGAIGSARLTALHDDARIQRIVSLSDRDDLRANLDRNEGTKIVFKRPGATEGLTDLPLHTDCGMGYHPIACPMFLVGVHLDDGTPSSGQLHVVAGSHRSTTPDPTVVDTTDWPIVALDTQAGDCTVHSSHVLHAAPPPVGELPQGKSARRTAYLCFAPPALFDALGPREDLVSAMQGEDGISVRPEQLL